MRYVGLILILACVLLLPKVWIDTDWPVWGKALAHALLMALAAATSVMLFAS